MAEKNVTLVSEFLLIAFTDCPEWGLPLFLLFLSIYVISLLGNAGMVLLIRVDGRLHTPMYFLLGHLSFVDICYSSTIVPQMLAVLLQRGAALSYTCCAAQFFLFTFFGSIDCYLLALMAYDRYVAVCRPLLYVTIMTEKARWGFVAGAYGAGFSSAFVRTITAFSLSFCGDNEIDFIFCDLPPLLKLTCGDSYTQEVVIVVFAIFVIPACMVAILVSYLFIVVAIMRIPSAGGRAKTFSTCASHLTTVSLFFGTLIFMYLRDNSGHSSQEDRVVSVFYTTVIPMLNPLIYSMRNKEVKEALRKVLKRAELY
ncbi:olfactory receptor family 9 subfamily Q member 4 [Canis lupus familiaris]|uniref:Olfactory receptor n=2 Tax=Canis lupus TaxID=9612 RepID=A0A8C0NI37_CANLF|nr:olfactory receptor family 9 subfamily Q member 4 [Canis lupus familiaris]XP_025308562.3 olfactory receptor 9Q1-like [Canis lupus dingo]|eukprot:XP_540601.2 olfactory receptor 9Q1 [Canis lupus familiaris]